MTWGKSATSRAYRRGAVLGLTIGEIFVLVSFILLLLLLLGQTTLSDAKSDLSVAKSETELARKDLSELVIFQEMAPRDRKRLETAVRNGWLKEILDVAETGELGDPSRFVERIRETNSPQHAELLNIIERQPLDVAERLTDLLTGNSNLERQLTLLDLFGGVDPDALTQALAEVDRLKAVDRSLLDALVEAAPTLTPEEVESFRDFLTKARDLPESLVLLDQITDLSLKQKERLVDLMQLPSQKIEVATTAGAVAAEQVDLEGWRTVVGALEVLDWDPARVESAALVASDLGNDPSGELEDLRQKVQRALALDSERRAKLATVLQDKLEEAVIAGGGDISAEGSIRLPDTTPFEKGESDLTPELRSFLDTICVPWFSTLRDLDFEVGELRVEGHASSVWNKETPPRDAYLNNLQLSQNRARNVLAFCLEKTWGSELYEWARSRAVAIGYSSSRLILDGGGNEDEAASQRVVLSADPERDGVIRAIGEALD